ncbi:MAG TPA: hypothetical protein VJ767_02470 [Nitrososphaeraceae archaeon]|nr:hypothetical protein [Nitrososphaeraceae archaeon]
MSLRFKPSSINRIMSGNRLSNVILLISFKRLPFPSYSLFIKNTKLTLLPKSSGHVEPEPYPSGTIYFSSTSSPQENYDTIN